MFEVSYQGWAPKVSHYFFFQVYKYTSKRVYIHVIRVEVMDEILADDDDDD